jgi:hypothetical protein
VAFPHPPNPQLVKRRGLGICPALREFCHDFCHDFSLAACSRMLEGKNPQSSADLNMAGFHGLSWLAVSIQ